MDSLHAVAKVVLQDQYATFQSLHERFLADKTAFLAAERRKLKGYVDEDSESEDLLWAFAYCNERIEFIDWSGEADEDQLRDFVTERLEALAGLGLDWSFLETFDENLDWDALERGDYIEKKLTVVDTELRKYGFLIAMLDRGDDAYYPFIASLSDLETIKGVQIGYTTVEGWKS